MLLTNWLHNSVGEHRGFTCVWSGLASEAYGPEGVRVRACENATDAVDPHVGGCTRLGTRVGIKQVSDPRGWDPLVGKPASLDGGCGLVGRRDWAERVRGSGRYLGLCRLPPFSLFSISYFYFYFHFQIGIRIYV